MLDKRSLSLVIGLLTKTKEYGVNWQPTTSSNSFIVTSDDVTISISHGTDDNTDVGFVAISLRDKLGKTMDNFWVEENEQEYKMMLELYTFARRKANNVDETMDSLIKKLSEGGEFGEKASY
jgi:hypothetical protein